MPAMISREKWDALVEAFRRRPGNKAAAAKAAGVTRKTAIRAWDRGYLNTAEWAEPIKDVLAREQVIARARLARVAAGEEMATAVAEAARLDASAQRREEAAIVRESRVGSMVLLRTVSQLAVSVQPLIHRLAAILDDRASDPNTTAEEILEVLEQVGRFARDANRCGETAVRLERLMLGEPETALATIMKEATPQDALYRLGALRESVARLGAKGKLPPGWEAITGGAAAAATES